MDIISSLMNYFKKKENDSAPEGVCPNCWGQQEYDLMIRQMYEDKQVDVNNHTAHHAFIKDFVVNRIEGIRMKKGNSSFECPTCQLKQDL